MGNLTVFVSPNPNCDSTLPGACCNSTVESIQLLIQGVCVSGQGREFSLVTDDKSPVTTTYHSHLSQLPYPGSTRHRAEMKRAL